MISMLLAGASAVEVGTALMADLGAAKAMVEAVEGHLERFGLDTLSSLVGAGRRA